MQQGGRLRKTNKERGKDEALIVRASYINRVFFYISFIAIYRSLAPPVCVPPFLARARAMPNHALSSRFMPLRDVPCHIVPERT